MCIMSNWTYADLAELTCHALELDPPPYSALADDLTVSAEQHAYLDSTTFCAHCPVAPALAYDDYCGGCLNDMVDAMAEQWQEDTSMSIYR